MHVSTMHVSFLPFLLCIDPSTLRYTDKTCSSILLVEDFSHRESKDLLRRLKNSNGNVQNFYGFLSSLFPHWRLPPQHTFVWALRKHDNWFCDVSTSYTSVKWHSWAWVCFCQSFQTSTPRGTGLPIPTPSAHRKRPKAKLELKAASERGILCHLQAQS